MRERLFEILYEKSFIYRENPPFTLVSGRRSSYYFDCKATTLDPEGVFLIGEVMLDALQPLIAGSGIQAVGGLTLGADPISISTSIAASRRGFRLSPLIVRKEPKEHGTQKWIEGGLKDVQSAVVIDDVITTGGSTITAIERMRESGLTVVQAAVIIDREEGGRERIENAAVPVISLFKRSDFDSRRISRT
ncbi:MAG: orotate phosphoribosyltransferase [Spirochaetes bacterium RBG_16_49_21]|nr:MAG: orotate phosphoribosyltransferase [Spirochaetes bacterium RBG_16_49_21]